MKKKIWCFLIFILIDKNHNTWQKFYWLFPFKIISSVFLVSIIFFTLFKNRNQLFCDRSVHLCCNWIRVSLNDRFSFFCAYQDFRFKWNLSKKLDLIIFCHFGSTTWNRREYLTFTFTVRTYESTHVLNHS